MTETVIEPISSKEEADLLNEWFETVRFDVESEGIPPLNPERDDEESRSVLMAQAIEEWFSGPPSVEVPFVDSDKAWDLVDFTKINMSRSVAKEYMEHEYRFQQMLEESRINVNHSKTDGKFAKGPGTGNGEPALSNRKADDLADRVQTPDGGFTVDPRTGKDIKEGFAVAMFPERSKEIPHKDVDRVALQKYTKDNADVLSQPGNMMGGWHDPDSGTVWLDVSRVTTDRREAIDLAKQHNQIAIFDLGSGNSINTGGTGRSSYPFVFTRANPYHDKAGKFAAKSGSPIKGSDQSKWAEDVLRDMENSPLPTESRASRSSTVSRQIIKKPNICQQCRMNDDPNNVPVHPNCDCDVVTDSIETGVADPQSRFLSRLTQDMVDMELLGALESAGIQLDAGSIAILDGDTARFADFAKWLETVQPYLDAGGQYVSIVVDDDSDEAIQNIEETVSAITEDSEQLVEALQNRKLWFSIAKAVI